MRQTLTLFRHARILKHRRSLWGCALWVCIAGIALVLAGCEAVQEYHGYIRSEENFCKVRQGIGKMTQEDVVALLGTPSCVLPYDPMTWYYVSHSLVREAFLKPRVPETLSTVVSFSKEGTVCSVKEAKGPINIALSERSTPLPSTHGEEFFKQFFRNVGRFAPIMTPTHR